MAELVENSGCQAEEHDATNSLNVTAPLCESRDPGVTNPQQKQKKLVLHVDLNNTILVSDGATAQGTVAALQDYLSTVTWGKVDKHGKHGCCSPLRGDNRTR